MKDKIKSVIEYTRNAGLYLLFALLRLLLACAVGAVCGLVGAAFFHSVSFVTGFRQEHGWILFLLPVFGLVSVLIYKVLRVGGIGTDEVFKSALSEKRVPILLTPAVFAASVLTHLGGGSAGREGAALQLGGSVAGFFSRVFHLSEKNRRMLTLCGMGAVFSAVFGTPVGAAVFALEVARVGVFSLSAVFPCVFSSITAFGISTLLGVKPERFHLSEVLTFGPDSTWKVLVIAAACAVVSIIFCCSLKYSKRIFKKLFKNDLVRIFVGGAVIVLLTVLVGRGDYNGGGIEIIERIFTDGEVRWEAFLLKLLFTVITVGAGYKGGEIIPSFFIGATLGGTLAVLLGISPAFGAAVGMAALFCGVTNCPLATIFLCIELFGSEGIIFFAMSVAVSFLLSGKASLYTGQSFNSPKLFEKDS